jgi:glutamate/tyrosine decarboxylase-like PLP-dependent enzyme
VLRQDAPYIEGHAGPPSEERRSGSIGVYVLEGSKPGMVAASLWLSHSLIPLDTSGHGRLMQENVRNAGELYTLLRDYPTLARGIRVKAVPLCEPNSNIVCFAFAPLGRSAPLEEINAVNERVYRAFSENEGEYFVSRTVLGPQRYRWDSVEDCVTGLGGTQQEYEASGLFLLRSVLMNPWYGMAKARGRYFLSEFVAALYAEASDRFAG